LATFAAMGRSGLVRGSFHVSLARCAGIKHCESRSNSGLYI
jgi:hypothetical protein